MNIAIRKAAPDDAQYVAAHDRRIKPQTLSEKIARGEVYAAFDGDRLVGWLRYNLFRDNTPFMSMLHLFPEYRRAGIGTRPVGIWEADMQENGFPVLLTSTAQNESAQHFYVKLGYRAIGGFTPEGEPYEIIFSKRV